MSQTSALQCPVCYTSFMSEGGRRSHQTQRNHFKISTLEADPVPIANSSGANDATTDPLVLSPASSPLSAEEKKRAKKARRKAKYLSMLDAIKQSFLAIIEERGIDTIRTLCGIPADTVSNNSTNAPSTSAVPARPSSEEVDRMVVEFVKQLIERDSSDEEDNGLGLRSKSPFAPNEADVFAPQESHEPHEPTPQNEYPLGENLRSPTDSNFSWEADDRAMDPTTVSESGDTDMEELTDDDIGTTAADLMELDSELGSSQGIASRGGTDDGSNTDSSNDTDSSVDTDSSGDADSDSDMSIEQDQPGASIGSCVPALQRLHQKKVTLGEDPAMPFADFLEFEFVKWMVERDLSQGSREELLKLPIIAERLGLSFSSNWTLNRLLDRLPTAGPRWRSSIIRITGNITGPDGHPLTEEAELWSRNILKVIQELLENVTYGEDMVFAPRAEYADPEQTERIYSEMWTGDWWRKIQDMLPPGATVLPVILASDATHLTNLGGGKKAWPVYITLGNIPKAIRRKPGSYATLLLGYLPVPTFDCFTEARKTHQVDKLFHACMKQLVQPLEDAGRHGVVMDCGDGHIQKCHPILAAYIADNPEQTMIACCARNLCYRCICPRDQRGNLETHPDRQPSETADAVEAKALGHSSALYVAQGLRPFESPFWAELPYCNISTALTPDILHQLHKGVFRDHLMNWCLALVRDSDVDHRYKAMPSHSTLRHFRAAVTKLKRTTGKEHKDMEKVFVGAMAGLVSKEVMETVVAVMDFIYYSQLRSHSTSTLRWMDDALERFHAAKNIFIDKGVRAHFNINKIHSMLHYSTAIRELGTMDGYNTEGPERLHIEFAKRAYKATNRLDFFHQMTQYLERREHVFKFDAYLRWAIPEYNSTARAERTLTVAPGAPEWKIARNSPFPPVSQSRLPEVFGVQYFDWALGEFLQDYFPDSDVTVSIHDHITVYCKASQRINDVFANDLLDMVHASPHTTKARLASLQRKSRFDTVLIRKDTVPAGQQSYGMSEHRIGQVRLIFTLPPKYGINTPLVYIHRFRGPSSRTPIQLTGMYKFEYERYPALYGNNYIGEILPLSAIRRSCHLIPVFGSQTPRFTALSPPSLESYEEFYLNPLYCKQVRHNSKAYALPPLSHPRFHHSSRTLAINLPPHIVMAYHCTVATKDLLTLTPLLSAFDVCSELVTPPDCFLVNPLSARNVALRTTGKAPAKCAELLSMCGKTPAKSTEPWYVSSTKLLFAGLIYNASTGYKDVKDGTNGRKETYSSYIYKKHSPPCYDDLSAPSELPHVPVADATVDAEHLIPIHPCDACTACQIWTAHAQNCALCSRDQSERVWVDVLRTTEDDFAPDLVAHLNNEGWILAMLKKLQDMEADNSKLKVALETTLNKHKAFYKELRRANEETCWAEDEIARLKDELFVAQRPPEPKGLPCPPMAELPPQARTAVEPSLPVSAEFSRQSHAGAHSNSRGDGEPLPRSNTDEEHSAERRRPKRKRIDEGGRKPKAQRLLGERGRRCSSA